MPWLTAGQLCTSRSFDWKNCADHAGFLTSVKVVAAPVQQVLGLEISFSDPARLRHGRHCVR